MSGALLGQQVGHSYRRVGSVQRRDHIAADEDGLRAVAGPAGVAVDLELLRDQVDEPVLGDADSLAIAKRTVELLGGEITADSENRPRYDVYRSARRQQEGLERRVRL